MVWDLLSLRCVVDIAQLSPSGLRSSFPQLAWIQVDNSPQLQPSLDMAVGQMKLHCTRGCGNLGRNDFYQKEGVMGREGNLRNSVGFGNVEVLGDLGRRSISAEGQGLDCSGMEATREAMRKSWTCIWKEG